MRPAADLGKIGYLDYSSLCSLNSMFFEFLLVFAGSLLVWCDNACRFQHRIRRIEWLMRDWNIRDIDPGVRDHDQGRQ